MYKLNPMLFVVMFALFVSGCLQTSDTSLNDQILDDITKRINATTANNSGDDMANNSTTGDTDLPEGKKYQTKVTSGRTHIIQLDLGKIISGGPPKDGIPSIDNPKFITLAQAEDFLSDNDIVLGIVVKGEARAYPYQIMNWHEIVNDEIQGEPVLITYCPLCSTGIAYERRLPTTGEVVEFGTSGKLWNSNLIMYDRKTNSYYSQSLGAGIVGELAGYELKRIPMDTVRWKTWKALHPDTKVLSRDTGNLRAYDRDPYAGFEKSEFIWFPVDKEDLRLFSKTIIFGVEFGGESKAYPEPELEKSILVNDVVGGTPILIVRDPETHIAKIFLRTLGEEVLDFELKNQKIVDKQTGSEWNFDGKSLSGSHAGESLERIPGVREYWFSWATFHQNTVIYTA